MPSQGQWTFQVTERADTPAAALIAQLRRPSDAPTAAACPAMLVVVPQFFLLDAAGKAIAPAVPTDSCGQARRDALGELDKLPFKAVSEQRLAQVRSPESVASGCSDDSKDLFAIDGLHPRRATGPVFAAAPVTTLKVCVYDRTDRDQEPVGKLGGAYTIEAKAVLAVFDKAGPAADCAVPHTRFAVLTSPSGGAFAMVELDGCHRLLRSDNTLGQLDAGAVGLLINK